MAISDQPGRVFAIVVFAPLLIYKGSVYNDSWLIILGLLLFFWDLYWIIYYPPKVID